MFCSRELPNQHPTHTQAGTGDNRLNVLRVEEGSKCVDAVGRGSLLDQSGTGSTARRLCEDNVAVQRGGNRHCADPAREHDGGDGSRALSVWFIF